MRTRGKERIIFASDYPVLSMERCLTEAKALDLPEDVLERWLFGNADAFFFGSPDDGAGPIRIRREERYCTSEDNITIPTNVLLRRLHHAMDAKPIDADNHYYQTLDAFTRHLEEEVPRTVA